MLPDHPALQEFEMRQRPALCRRLRNKFVSIGGLISVLLFVAWFMSMLYKVEVCRDITNDSEAMTSRNRTVHAKYTTALDEYGDAGGRGLVLWKASNRKMRHLLADAVAAEKKRFYLTTDIRCVPEREQRVWREFTTVTLPREIQSQIEHATTHTLCREEARPDGDKSQAWKPINYHFQSHVPVGKNPIGIIVYFYGYRTPCLHLPKL